MPLELTAADREAARLILDRRLSPPELRAVVDDIQGRQPRQRRKVVEWIVAETEQPAGRLRSRLPHTHLAEFLVDLASVDLLASRELRLRLARGASSDELDRLHEYPSGTRGRGGRDSMAHAIASRYW